MQTLSAQLPLIEAAFSTSIQRGPAANAVLGHSTFLSGNYSSRLRSASTLARSRAVKSAPQSWSTPRATATSDRPLWLPGSIAPEHLDGSLPGDFGFDPLDLGNEPAALAWYVQAELVHSRFAMAGVTGILVTDILRVTGLKDLPVWYEAGAAKYDIADPKMLFLIQLILFAFVETKRLMDLKTPGSQGTEDSWFFGVEPAFLGLAPGYPGGPLFNPLGLASDLSTAKSLQTKELKNGRLAMVAALGFFVQASATGQSPVENLLAHVADPWHTTVVQTVANALS